MNLKKNDKVIILAGKDKGKTGEIREVMPSKNKVVVTGINMISKHVKPNQNNKAAFRRWKPLSTPQTWLSYAPNAKSI